MKQIGRLDILFLVCLIGVLTAAGLWRSKPEPTDTPTVLCVSPTLTPGLVITATPVVMGTPKPHPRPQNIYVPPKSDARGHYTAPKRKPGQYQEGGDSLYTY
ncbi:MAG: hypothetical protein J0I12_16825 [Candidatus Eremiobacteraeota bacterium]|nr:hypothetical protein [Candidatus Eremiobacteraeota bacterium]